MLTIQFIVIRGNKYDITDVLHYFNIYQCVTTLMPHVHTFGSVEYTDPSVPPVVYLVALQQRVAVVLYPHPRHRVVVDFVPFDHPQPVIVDENPAILPAPNLVPSYQRIATRSEVIICNHL